MQRLPAIFVSGYALRRHIENLPFDLLILADLRLLKSLNIQIYTIIPCMRFSFKNLNVSELSFCHQEPSFCDIPIRELPGTSSMPDICLLFPLYR